MNKFNVISGYDIANIILKSNTPQNIYMIHGEEDDRGIIKETYYDTDKDINVNSSFTQNVLKSGDVFNSNNRDIAVYTPYFGENCVFMPTGATGANDLEAYKSTGAIYQAFLYSDNIFSDENMLVLPFDSDVEKEGNFNIFHYKGTNIPATDVVQYMNGAFCYANIYNNNQYNTLYNVVSFFIELKHNLTFSTPFFTMTMTFKDVNGGYIIDEIILKSDKLDDRLYTTLYLSFPKIRKVDSIT